MHQKPSGSARTRWGSLSAPPDHLAVLGDWGPPGREGREWEGRKREKIKTVYMLLDCVMYFTTYIPLYVKNKVYMQKLLHKGAEFCSRNTLKLTYDYLLVFENYFG